MENDIQILNNEKLKLENENKYQKDIIENLQKEIEILKLGKNRDIDT